MAFFNSIICKSGFLLFLFFCSVIMLAESAAEPVLIGTTRWDAKAKNRKPGSVYMEVLNTMGQKKWDDPALDYWPWFTEVDSQGNLVEMNENTVAIMEKENEDAYNAGIDYWAFLRYRDLDIDSGCGWLNEQYYRYQESSNKNLMKFCWILSHSFYSWDIEKVKIINAMKDSQYVKVLGNRPLLYIYSDATSEKLNELRSMAISAGLGNPYIVAFRQWEGWGEDACSVYWPNDGCTSVGQTYTNFITNISASWASTSGNIVPWTPMNTDGRPYAERPPSWWPSPPYIWTHPPTPSEFAEMVQSGINFVKANTGKCPANTVIIKEWNGPEESGLLMPGRHHGAAKLNGLKLVNKEGGTVMPSDTTPVTSLTAYAKDSVVEVWLSTQLTVVATRSNGHLDTVTADCQVTSLDPVVASVNSFNVTGLSAGIARIRVLLSTYQGPRVDTVEIRIAPSTGTFVPDSTNLILNPDFTTGTTSWDFYTSGSSASLSTDVGMAKVSITDGGSSTTAIQLYQSGYPLVPGKSYLVRFKAKASSARTLTASIHLHDSPWTSYWSQTVNLEASEQTFGYYLFTYNGAPTSVIRINFQCGSNNQSVWVDDVEIYAAKLVTTGEESAMPSHLQKGNGLTAYPNPFNPGTVIEYALLGRKTATYSIYGINGNVIRTFALGHTHKGKFSWNGKDGKGIVVPAGLYIGRLVTDDGMEATHRIIFMK